MRRVFRQVVTDGAGYLVHLLKEAKSGYLAKLVAARNITNTSVEVDEARPETPARADAEYVMMEKNDFNRVCVDLENGELNGQAAACTLREFIVNDEVRNQVQNMKLTEMVSEIDSLRSSCTEFDTISGGMSSPQMKQLATRCEEVVHQLDMLATQSDERQAKVPKPPPGMALLAEVTAKMKERQLRDPEQWTLTMAE